MTPVGRAVVVLLLALVAGCDRDPDTHYGTVRGASLNGVSAFVQLLRDAGHRTATRRSLAERIVGRHDVAVVFADQFGPPNDDARQLLDRFRGAAGEQTVVYVMRDSDAAIGYWQTVADLPGLDADKAATARDRFHVRRARLRLSVGTTFPARDHDDDPLAYGLAARRQAVPGPIAVAVVDAAEPVTAAWPLARRLEPPARAQPLWSWEGEPLLVEITTENRRPPARDEPPADDDDAVVDRDRTLLLASAAPLLNGSLADPGNRRLARDLVARLPEAARVVVVGSAVVRPDDDESLQPSRWRLLAIPPNPWIAAQAVLAMILFCWWKAPIFGRPQRETAGRVRDFGHHVAALGSLLRKSGDETFARGRLEAWRRPGERSEPRRAPQTEKEPIEETT